MHGRREGLSNQLKIKQMARRFMPQYVISALYKFVNFPDYRDFRLPLLDYCLAHEIKGTLLLAEEGINGTVAGSRKSIDALYAWLNSSPPLDAIEHKESYAETPPFYRMKVKLKREIVTMGVAGIDPKNSVGTYVDPRDWNDLISDPDVTLIDTRNAYEVEIGSFRGAINPNTDSFRDFPQYVAKSLEANKHRKVAMFCTGGIRCEKSTAYLKQQGFEQVYHLKGGILSYLEQVPEADSLWQGECFVFDNRVSVNHQLEKGRHELCHGCRQPITPEDMASEHYQEGVSCPRCFDRLTDEQRARFKERQKQINLAKMRGEAHIGATNPKRRQ